MHYNEGLTLILGRLGQIEDLDVRVESREVEGLEEEERRLVVDERPYPIEVVDDVEELKRGIGAAQAKVGRRPKRRGAGTGHDGCASFYSFMGGAHRRGPTARQRVRRTQ